MMCCRMHKKCMTTSWLMLEPRWWPSISPNTSAKLWSRRQTWIICSSSVWSEFVCEASLSTLNKFVTQKFHLPDTYLLDKFEGWCWDSLLEMVGHTPNDWIFAYVRVYDASGSIYIWYARIPVVRHKSAFSISIKSTFLQTVSTAIALAVRSSPYLNSGPGWCDLFACLPVFFLSQGFEISRILDPF